MLAFDYTQNIFFPIIAVGGSRNLSGRLIVYFFFTIHSSKRNKTTIFYLYHEGITHKEAMNFALIITFINDLFFPTAE